MSGIAMGAVFENVTIPVQEVGVGRLGWLLRLGAAVSASTATPAMMKKNKQKIRRNRGGVNVPFAFVVIQFARVIGLIGGKRIENTFLAKAFLSPHLPGGNQKRF
jgi:hypothetical protein